ncbi:MAG: hypothetical protein V1897_01950 [Pseudomonadota bacterium]
MTDSASLKIHRASEHINELNALFQKNSPFTYILETNTKIGQRATFAKKNEAVIQRAALICGDVVHNLRSALDHAYWEVVSPVATTEKERRLLQFPFSETEARLDETMKTRLADRVSPSFYQALIDLKPHGEPGGNELLYLIHKLDIIDKHKLLIPTGDYTKISSEILIKQVPDFPRGLVNCGFGQNNRDVVWNIPPMNRAKCQVAKIPDSGILEQELNVPVDIVFIVAGTIHFRPVIPTFHKLIDVAETTILIIRNA